MEVVNASDLPAIKRDESFRVDINDPARKARNWEDTYRGLGVVQILINGKIRVEFFFTHLEPDWDRYHDHENTRRIQTKTILTYYIGLSQADIVVFMGDMNDNPVLEDIGNKETLLI